MIQCRLTNSDASTAVNLAKRMIVDGRMPTPKEAKRQLAVQLERDRQLGEPMKILGEPMPILDLVERNSDESQIT